MLSDSNITDHAYKKRVLPQFDMQVSSRQGQIDALEEQKESLKEVRQMLEHKRALLHGLESGRHKNF